MQSHAELFSSVKPAWAFSLPIFIRQYLSGVTAGIFGAVALIHVIYRLAKDSLTDIASSVMVAIYLPTFNKYSPKAKRKVSNNDSREP